MKVNITKDQLKAIVRAEGCDCTECQWNNRGTHCTMTWLRCSGRIKWKTANCPVFQKGLARLEKGT